MNRMSCLAVAALALSACATRPMAAPSAAASTAPITQAQAHDALFALFKASDEASLKLNHSRHCSVAICVMPTGSAT